MAEPTRNDSAALDLRSLVPPRAYGLPSAADFINYARLLNGTCPKCHTINAHDGSPRCECAKEADSNG